jgi:uncharacterized membrane protein
LSETPQLALTISFWLHLLATVAWVGGQAVTALVVIPLSRRTLDQKMHHKMLAGLSRRLGGIGWLSLMVLLGTGLFQMAASENYAGFLSASTPWGLAILLKHVAFISIIGLSAWQTWELWPRLERVALLQARGRSSAEEEDALRRRETAIMRGNAALSAVVLLLTAVARVVG